jgi:molybdate transport system regulatory protein
MSYREPFFSRIGYKIWLETKGKVLFGDGRLEILKAVKEEGSLLKASKRLNMSYRAAWGRIRASEERLGIKLVEKRSPAPSKGAVLTPEAEALLDFYQALKDKADRFFRQIQKEIDEVPF